MLIWFRSERVRTVTWGGNPFKSPSSEDDPSELSPRRSFAQWHQVVEGTSDPWTAADLSAARLIGASVNDVIVQFRAVRILIAQDQLEQVLRQVRSSDQQVVVADARGILLESNAGVQRMLCNRARRLAASSTSWRTIFADPGSCAPKSEGAAQTDTGPGEAKQVSRTRGASTKAVLVRADPVFAASDRVLGFVVLFADLTDRKAARVRATAFPGRHPSQPSQGVRRGRFATEIARPEFDVVRHRKCAARRARDHRRDRSPRMPALLESVRTSVARTAEVLEQLAVIEHGRAAQESLR